MNDTNFLFSNENRTIFCKQQNIIEKQMIFFLKLLSHTNRKIFIKYSLYILFVYINKYMYVCAQVPFQPQNRTIFVCARRSVEYVVSMQIFTDVYRSDRCTAATRCII